MRDAVASHVCLSVEGLTKRFGGFYALNELNMDVTRGHIHALIGPNGAGKTTFFNLVTGVLPADTGRIVFNGQPLDDARPSRRTLKGIARTFQNIRLFPHLTVMETIMIGEHCRTYASVWKALGGAILCPPFREAEEERRMRANATELLEFLGLADKQEAKASDLPYGEQRKLELARALATSPQVILLDEIGGGLTDSEAQELVLTIQELKRRGIGIVWIEHIVHVLLQVVDRLICMDAGRIIADGSPEAVMSDPDVVKAYLGGGPK